MANITIDSQDLINLVLLCKESQMDAAAHRGVYQRLLLTPLREFVSLVPDLYYEDRKSAARDTYDAKYAVLSESLSSDPPQASALHRFLQR
jgi:hypothetical protein